MQAVYTQQEVQKMVEELDALRKKISEKDVRISKLESDLLWFRKQFFGKTSERFIATNPDERQLDLFGEQLSAQEKAELEKAAQQEQELITKTITVKKSRTPRKDISMDNLRIEETIIDPEGINEEDYVHIGSEVTDKLAHRPAELYIKRTIRRKFALKDHSAVIIAPLPASAIHKCMADTTLLTEIIIQKYLYHIPFHRQIARFSELGVKISSSTVGDWFSQSCELLKPLYDLLQRRVLSTDYIQVDESTLPVIDNEKHRAVKGYIWVVRNPDNGEVFFHYDRGSRSQKTAMVLLRDFRGAIQSDGYQVYNRFENMDGKLMLGCWAHARSYQNNIIIKSSEFKQSTYT